RFVAVGVAYSLLVLLFEESLCQVLSGPGPDYPEHANSTRHWSALTEEPLTKFPPELDSIYDEKGNLLIPGKPSKFDAHVDEDQYVDNPLNTTLITESPAPTLATETDPTPTTAEPSPSPTLNPSPASNNQTLDSKRAESKNSTSTSTTTKPVVDDTTYISFTTVKPVTDKKFKSRTGKSYWSPAPRTGFPGFAGHFPVKAFAKDNRFRKRYLKKEWFKGNGTEVSARKRSKRAIVHFPTYYRVTPYRVYHFKDRWDGVGVTYADANKRFVRFPPADAGFRPNRPPLNPWPQQPAFQTSFYQQPLPPVPSMGPRSPRLVFRDPVEPGTLQAPFGQGNLQDLTAPDDNREEHKPNSISLIDSNTFTDPSLDSRSEKDHRMTRV
ncbi:unnamed protein product, partial [Bemisia tabaci]